MYQTLTERFVAELKYLSIWWILEWFS